MSSSALMDTISLILDRLLPAGLIPVGAVLILLRRKHFTRKSVGTAAISLLLFEALFFAAYYFTYTELPDAGLMLTYLIFGAVGAVPVALKLNFLGYTFLAGSAAGWLLDCAVSANMNPLQPNMSAGIVNLAALIGGSVLAIFLEVFYQLFKKSS